MNQQLENIGPIAEKAAVEQVSFDALALKYAQLREECDELWTKNTTLQHQFNTTQGALLQAQRRVAELESASIDKMLRDAIEERLQDLVREVLTSPGPENHITVKVEEAVREYPENYVIDECAIDSKVELAAEKALERLSISVQR